MPATTVKIEGARFVLTLDGGRRIIRDGAILIEGQRIARVGKTQDLSGVTADRVIDATEMVVSPGMCNGHIHLSYAHANRGIFPDDLGERYLPSVFKLQKALTEEEEYLVTLLAITELLKYGTTTMLDPGSTKFLDACLQAYRDSGARVVVGASVNDVPNPLDIPITSTEEAVANMESAIRKLDGQLDGRLSAWAMPFGTNMASPELLKAAKALADKYNTGLTLHHNFNPQSTEAFRHDTGHRPTEYLRQLGALGPNVLLAHVLGMEEEDLNILADTDTKLVMCPTAALKMALGMDRIGALPEMLDKGLTVGLGTDAGNNSNLIETHRSMYLAAVLYKDARNDVGMVPAETALEMATVNGARALGLGDDIGAIEPGKKADLVLYDTQRPEWRTILNPVNSLVYSADGRSVHTVIVDGHIVVEDHQPTFVNEHELIQKVQALGEDLMARTKTSFPPRWPVV